MNRMLGQPASLLTQEPVPEHAPVVEERPASSPSPAPAVDQIQNRPEVQPPAPEPSFNFLQVNTVQPQLLIKNIEFEFNVWSVEII